VPAPDPHRPRGAAASIRARALVAPPQRAGGQAQYIERLRPEASGNRPASLRDWVLGNLASDLSIDVLSRRKLFVRRLYSTTGIFRKLLTLVESLRTVQVKTPTEREARSWN
jgi:hypothetical protein